MLPTVGLVPVEFQVLVYYAMLCYMGILITYDTYQGNYFTTTRTGMWSDGYIHTQTQLNPPLWVFDGVMPCAVSHHPRQDVRTTDNIHMAYSLTVLCTHATPRYN